MTCVYGAVGRPREAQTSSLRVLCLVNCWQTAVQDSVRHFFRLKLEKALAFIWPIFSEPIWLEGAVLHRGWEGEEPKNSVPLGRRGYAPSRKKPGLWKMEGERKTRLKGVWESERKSDWQTKEVRRIFPVQCLCCTTVQLDRKRQEQH